jgi:uncharacterized protein YecA (UPF0149 family)
VKRTDKGQTPQPMKSTKLEDSKQREQVPKFYFPHGRAVTSVEQKSFEDNLAKVFEKGSISDLKPVCALLLKIPTIFKEMLFTRIKLTHPTSV